MNCDFPELHHVGTEGRNDAMPVDMVRDLFNVRCSLLAYFSRWPSLGKNLGSLLPLASREIPILRNKQRRKMAYKGVCTSE